MERSDKYNIKKSHIFFIIVYYILLFIIGIIIISVSIKFNMSDFSISLDVGLSYLASIGMALLGCSLYYIRKTYKSLVSGKFIGGNEVGLKEIGIFIYLITRPLFAISFSFIVYLLHKMILEASIEGSYTLSKAYYIISSVEGFFVGFLVGRVVERAEEKGEHFLGELK